MYGYGYRYNSGLVIGAGGGAPFANTYSLLFDGVDDYLTSANPLTSGSAYTISIFAKLNATPTLNNFFNISDGVNSIALCYWWSSGNGMIFKSGNGATYSLSVNPNTALWHSYIFTFDGSTTTKIYVDGISREVSDGTALGVVSVNAMEISRGLGGGYQSNMNVDEVSVFNRVVTPTEIATLSTAPTVDLASLNPLAWYRMGDNGAWKSPQWLIPNNENFAANKVSNYSMDFDGVDDFIDCGNDSVFNLTNAMTLSAWVKPSSLPNDKFIIAKRWTSSAYQMATNLLYKPSASIWIGGTRYNVFGTTSLSVGTWYNIIITFNGLELKVYLNGSLENTTAAVGNLDQTTDIVSIAKGLNTNSYNFNGNIDEVAIWNTVENPTNIYNGGEPTTISGAVAHYKMGENSTFLTNWTVPDEVGANDGTSANMTIEDRIGEAPSSENNAVSLNMDFADVVPDTP